MIVSPHMVNLIRTLLQHQSLHILWNKSSDKLIILVKEKKTILSPSKGMIPVKKQMGKLGLEVYCMARIS